MSDYQQKYLKYKNKYIQLKNELDGGFGAIAMAHHNRQQNQSRQRERERERERERQRCLPGKGIQIIDEIIRDRNIFNKPISIDEYIKTLKEPVKHVKPI